jgi:O-antigen biosynthesis protein WbqV
MVLPRANKASAVRALVFVHDLVAAALAYQIAIVFRLGFEPVDAHLIGSLCFMAVAAACGLAFGINRGLWRYASVADLEAIIKTATVAVLLFALLHFLVNRLDSVPRSVILMAWPLLIGLLSGSRIAYRLHRARRARKSDARERMKHVILVGLSEDAEAFIKAASERSDMPYGIVGIIDERGRRMGLSLRGVEVLGDLRGLEDVIERQHMGDEPIDGIIISKQSIMEDTATLDRLHEVASRAKIELLRLPAADVLRTDHVNTRELKPLRIELRDLLPRVTVALDAEPIRRLVEGARVLVTGSGGSIGSELCRQLVAMRPASIVLVDASEYLLYLVTNELERLGGSVKIVSRIGNVRDRRQMFSLFEECRPQLVFHAAALKHVPIVEHQPLEGLATNVIGTRNIADASVRVAASAMIVVSTDKAVNPTNLMGASKRMAEVYCQSLDLTSKTKFVTVRFGNVLGSAGSVVPLFEDQIRSGGPLTVTHPEIERFFMTIPEAVQLILHAMNEAVSSDEVSRGRIFVLDMGKPVKIVDIARKMIQLAGLRPDVDVQIKFVGLRPGEKLYEELFDPRETLVATRVPSLLAASPLVRLDQKAIDDSLNELVTAIGDDDLGRALSIVARMVPEYTPGPLMSRKSESPARQPLQVIKGAKA